MEFETARVSFEGSDSDDEPLWRVMRPVPLTVHSDMWADEAWQLLLERDVAAAPVVDDSGHALGLLRRDRVHRAMWPENTDEGEDGWSALWLPTPDLEDGEAPPCARWRVRSLVERDIDVIRHTTPVAAARRTLAEAHLEEMFVVNERGVVMGVVSQKALAETRVEPRRRRILVADDDRCIRETLSAILGEEGYEVMLAKNGAEALTAIQRRQHPDLVLLDLMMPVMTGWELLDRMQHDRSTPAVPVIVMTAFPLVSTASELDGKAQLSFSKPIDIDRLLEAVRTVTDPPNIGHGL